MLAATVRLTEILQGQNASVGNADTSFETMALVDVIQLFGGPEDAEALLPFFLESPGKNLMLLDVLRRHGTPETGATLFETMFEDGMLREDAPDDVLQAIGYLGYEPAAETLLNYAENAAHHQSRAACLGLLDLACVGQEKKIAAILTSLEHSSLFPEFLPSLAVKTGDPSILEFIIKLGEKTSADNVGGVMLGVAAFGAPGKAHFERFLREPRWEGDFASAGTPFALQTGAFALGFKPTEIFDSIQDGFRTNGTSRVLHYRFSCLLILVSGVAAGEDVRTDIPRIFGVPREDGGAVLPHLFGESRGDEAGLEAMAVALNPLSPYGQLDEACRRIECSLNTRLRYASLMKAMQFATPR